MALKKPLPKEDTPFVTDGGVIVGTEEEMRTLFEKLKAEQESALDTASKDREALDADDR